MMTTAEHSAQFGPLLPWGLRRLLADNASLGSEDPF